MAQALSHLRRPGLSKSRISAFEQCPRRLWQQVHARERSDIDASMQMSFAAGHAVGDLACSQIANGIMVEAEPDLQAALARTAELVAIADRPIFEATFEYEGVLVRVDILVPEHSAAGVAWHIHEVKSSGSAKSYHIGDLATQYWVIANCGVTIASASIRHIDTSFVLETLDDYDGIFSDAPLLDEISGIAATRDDLIEDIRRMAKAHYYHRDQRGSFSIKAVLPTLLPELAYGDLAIADGGDAQLAYVEATDPGCSAERRAELAAGLVAYCERDTLAMVEIYRELLGR